MRYHHPSFMHYFEQKFPIDFCLYAYNWTLYVIPPHDYFSGRLLCQYVTEALIEALEAPLDAPDGPRQRSLFEAPPVPHCEALAGALADSWEYLLNAGRIHFERGEEERIEYRVNLRVIQGIVQDVRRSEDVKLALLMIDGEFFMSDRLLIHKIRQTRGRDIGPRRAREALRGLIELGFCHNNGRLRTAGREVTQWPKP